MKKSTTPALPPTATPAQLLRLFCGPAVPALMLPFLAPGKNGRGVVTVATDGEMACLWMAGKLGQYKDWGTLSAFGDRNASPLVNFRALWRNGASHALELARPDKGGETATLFLLGTPAVLPARLLWALSHCDTCYLGHSTFKPVEGQHVAVSVKASIGRHLIHAVIFCQGFSLNQPTALMGKA